MASRAELRAVGVDARAIDAHVAGGRWRRVGPAVILHNSRLSPWQQRRVLLINCGPHSLLTSFTAAQEWGLRRWERDEIHVLAPLGAQTPQLPAPLARRLVLHRVRDWSRVAAAPAQRLHRLAPALLLAAAGFASPRPGCGIIAAAVQQRLLRPDELRSALEQAPRTRHRRHLLRALADIEQGADALSEIDFTRLCRRYRLPRPTRQGIRQEPGGRRRYLDIEWKLPDGRVVAAEVDGAHHIEDGQWSADQLRQNEIVIGGTMVLRFPSSVVRHDPALVAAQLRRALTPARLT